MTRNRQKHRFYSFKKVGSTLHYAADCIPSFCNQIMIDSYPAVFRRTAVRAVVQALDSITASTVGRGMIQLSLA